MCRSLILALFLVLPATGVARDFAPQFPRHHASKYFDFRYQRTEWDAASFARFADGLVDLVNRQFVPVKFDSPIRVLVLPDRPAFQRFLRVEFNERNPPNFGIYLPHHKLFATYESSGLGTFAHEIMHPLVDYNLKNRPAWAVEAIPAFFEKFFGYWTAQAPVLYWGYQNGWRIEALGERLTKIDLERLVAGREPRDGYDTSELRLVSMFLWQQGKFKRLLRLIAENKRDGYPSFFEAAMEKRMKDVLPLWKAYLADLAAHRAVALQVPASEIFENETAFTRFMLSRGLPILPQESAASSGP